MAEHPRADIPFVYKICPEDLWQEAVDAHIFGGAGIDLVDGFIHFSTADQVAVTADLHFNGVQGLVLVKIRTDGLGLIWEESRGGQLFPHLYKDLPLAYVDDVYPMPLDGKGNHEFPPEITPL